MNSLSRSWLRLAHNRHLVPGVDRLWGSASVVTSVGPIEVPSRADLVRALRILADHSEVTRIGRVFSADHRTWHATPDLDAFCAKAVHLLPVGDGESPGETVVRILEHGRDGLPLAIVVVGNSVSLNVAHALGDGYYMARLLPAVIEVARTGRVPAWASRTIERRPLTAGLWNHYGRHPARVAAVVRRARAAVPAAPINATALVQPDQGTGWTPSVDCHFRASSTSALRDLKNWRKQYASGLSTIPLTVAATELALGRLGITTTGAPLVLFDARRFLPRRESEVPGNFCAGLRLAVADVGDPIELHHSMAEAIELGRPLTAMSVGVVAGRRAALHAGAHRLGPTGRPDGRWDVAYTHMGRPPEIVRLPWLAGATDDAGNRNEPSYYLGVLTPSGPSGVTFAIAEIGHRINVSVSFHRNVVDRAMVEKVVDLLCDDPVALLENHRLARSSGELEGVR
ncbi:MAG: hypothetical protein JWM76_58 [Pseudonocardiales bacterium]|nr:hypothetical protein [Pseudonocardiales bacterium]